MFGDPIFLLSLIAVFCLIGIWIYQVLQDTLTDQSQQIIYIAGLSSSLIGVYRIFVNAGDLGSVLLIGSIICLIILLVGIYNKNTLLKTTGRGWFVPVFLIFMPRFFKQCMLENTSSDSKIFLISEIPSDIAPINKYLIEMDLSESTEIVFLKFLIFSPTNTE